MANVNFVCTQFFYVKVIEAPTHMLKFIDEKIFQLKIMQ